LIFRRKYWTPN